MKSGLTQTEWDKKIIDLGGSILQSWKWGEFQERLGHSVFRFSSENHAMQILQTQLLAGKTYIYSPRGPLGDISKSLADLDELAHTDRGIVFARIEPAQDPKLPRAVKEIQPSHNWYLDLEDSQDRILSGMKPKTRYNINLAARKNVVVREGGKADLIEVYKLLLETAGRNGFHLHPQNYYWQMWESLPPENLKILIAEYKGRPLAASLVSFFGTTATYLHGGSSQAMKEAMAPYLLHWEAIKLAQSLGCKYYDFGGIAPEGAGPDHPWSGISRFKRSFGGFEVAYPGTFEKIYSPLWYNVYKNARKLRSVLKI